MTSEQYTCSHKWSRHTHHCVQCFLTRKEWDAYVNEMRSLPPQQRPKNFVSDWDLGLPASVDKYIRDGVLTELALGMPEHHEHMSKPTR